MISIEDLGDALENCSLDDQIEIGFQNLPDEAKDLECPFTWKPELELPVDTLINKIEEKIEEIAEDEEGGFLWRTFILNLVLCYEYYRKGSIDCALLKQNKMEDILRKGKENSANNSCSIAIGGVEHICLSCSCFLLLKLQKYKDAKSVFHKIDLYSNMNDRNKASIWGTRAAVYMEYGYIGTKKSLEYIEKAIKLDKNEAEWHFLRAKALGRSRRIDNFNGVPEDIEIESLKRAVELSENVSYKIFLAHVYRETAFKLYSLHQDDMNKYKTKCDNMNNNSHSLFKDALDIGKHFVHVNIRCAQGFLKFPEEFRDLDLAHNCILTALRLAHNNPLVNHVAGQYYERVRDIKNAKDHYMKASEGGAFGASMDYIKLNWRLHSGYDPLNWNVAPDYDIMSQFLNVLECHKQNYNRHEICCQIGSYWYFIRNNFKEALKWWKIPLEEDPASNKLEIHKCILIKMKPPVNIHDIIFDEARLQLENESISSEDHELFSGLVSEYSKSRPPSSPLSWRNKILSEIKENLLKRSHLPNRGQTGMGRERTRSNQNWREKHHGNVQNEETLDEKRDDWRSRNRSNESRSGFTKNSSNSMIKNCRAESRQKGDDDWERPGFGRTGSTQNVYSGFKRKDLESKPTRNGNDSVNRNSRSTPTWTANHGLEGLGNRYPRNGDNFSSRQSRSASGNFARENLGERPSRNENNTVNRDSRSRPPWRGISTFERKNLEDRPPRNGNNRDFRSRPSWNENGNFKRENLGVRHRKNGNKSVNQDFNSRSTQNENELADIDFRSRPIGDANGSFDRDDLGERPSQNENQAMRGNFTSGSIQPGTDDLEREGLSRRSLRKENNSEQ